MSRCSLMYNINCHISAHVQNYSGIIHFTLLVACFVRCEISVWIRDNRIQFFTAQATTPGFLHSLSPVVKSDLLQLNIL